MARFRFSFWLDSDKDNELLLMEEIDELKRGRSFASTIRDGIRLIVDLRAGRFDVLFELFPDARKRFKGDDPGRNGDDLKAIRDQLARLEQATLAQFKPPALVASGAKTAISGPQQLAAPGLSKPRFDDDDGPLVAIKRDRSTESAANFLKSAFALQP